MTETEAKAASKPVQPKDSRWPGRRRLTQRWPAKWWRLIRYPATFIGFFIVGFFLLMAVIGPIGFLWSLAAFFVPIAVYAVVRIVRKARPAQQRFINLPPRSSTGAPLLADRQEDGAGRESFKAE